MASSPERDTFVYVAKLAEQAERYDGVLFSRDLLLNSAEILFDYSNNSLPKSRNDLGLGFGLGENPGVMNPIKMDSDPIFVIENLVAGGLEEDIVTAPDFSGDLADPPTVIVEGVHFLVHVEKGGGHLRRLRPDFGAGNRLR
nr:14-3-3 protein [Ipomoea batatas]GME13365.1 14-3-3 protein [Ipomoea batatas]GME19794.1 14-3-3 protein [Ipomoea batatas]